MRDILNQTWLPRLEIFQNRWIIFCIAAGVIAIGALALVAAAVKRWKSKKIINIELMGAEQPSDKKPVESYELIVKRIKQVEKKCKSILFASVEPGALPITLPVNVAIGLTKNKKRCLLIDLDIGRDAIAEAFGLGAQKDDLSVKAVRTEFENLWLWPGHNFARLKQMNINEIVRKASGKFDFTLISAPSLVSSPDRRQIISAAQAAFICAKDASEASQLAELIKPLDCRVIGRIRIPP